MEPVALANLLAQLIPLGINVYTQIQQANTEQLKPIEDVLALADKNWQSITDAANKELGNK